MPCRIISCPGLRDARNILIKGVSVTMAITVNSISIVADCDAIFKRLFEGLLILIPLLKQTGKFQQNYIDTERNRQHAQSYSRTIPDIGLFPAKTI